MIKQKRSFFDAVKMLRQLSCEKSREIERFRDDVLKLPTIGWTSKSQAFAARWRRRSLSIRRDTF